MSPAENLASLPLERENWPRWLWILLLALLLHLAALLPRFPWHALAPHPPVEIHTVSPEDLQRIKDEWKKNRPRQLLLDQGEMNVAKDAPEDARYESDRNRRVERETRARNGDVMPKPGASAARSGKADRPLPKLEKLGLGSALKFAQPAPTSQEAQAARAGAEQYLLDRDTPEGAENALNAVESRYYSFYSRMYGAIGPLWQSKIRSIPYRRRVPQGDYASVVDVVLNDEGDLLRVDFVQTSGIGEFDDAIRETMRAVTRFPNPPKALRGPDGLVHTGWTFTVQVGSGFNMEYAPPERAY